MRNVFRVAKGAERREGGGTLNTILFSCFPRGKKIRLEKYSNPGIREDIAKTIPRRGIVSKFPFSSLPFFPMCSHEKRSTYRLCDLFELILDPPKSESTHLLNLVVLDVPDHSGQLHSRLPRGTPPHSGYPSPPPLHGGAAVMVEITFPLLRPATPVVSAPPPPVRRSTSQPLFHCLPRDAPDYTQPKTTMTRTRTRNRTRTSQTSLHDVAFSHEGRALGSLRAAGDIRNTVAIILLFDLTSRQASPMSDRYDPTAAILYATRIRTLPCPRCNPEWKR